MSNDAYDWWIKSLQPIERDNSVVQKIVNRYQAQGTPDPDDENIRHVLYRILHESDRWGRTVEGAMPDPAPAPPPPMPGPTLGPITVSGRIFEAGGQPFDWREASAFTLQKLIIDSREAEARAFVRTMKGHGINVLRCAGGLNDLWWGNQHGHDWRFGPHQSGWAPSLVELCDLLSAEGMYLRYFLFDTSHMIGLNTLSDKVNYARRVRDIVKDYPGVITEVANEPGRGHALFSTGDADLVRIAQELTSDVVALGADWGPHGHELTYDVPPADYVTFHAERRTEYDGWNWVKRLGDYGVVKTGQRPVVSSEPINAGVKGKPGDHEPNSAIWAAYGALSRIVPSHGYAPCWHSDGGLFCEAPTGQTLTCLQEFIAGCDAVPLGARTKSWTNGQTETSPWEGYSQTDPPSDNRPFRIYGRGIGTAYIGVAIRHRPGWTWPSLRYPVQKVSEWNASGGGAFNCSVWRGV